MLPQSTTPKGQTALICTLVGRPAATIKCRRSSDRHCDLRVLRMRNLFCVLPSLCDLCVLCERICSVFLCSAFLCVLCDLCVKIPSAFCVPEWAGASASLAILARDCLHVFRRAGGSASIVFFFLIREIREIRGSSPCLGRAGEYPGRAGPFIIPDSVFIIPKILQGKKTVP